MTPSPRAGIGETISLAVDSGIDGASLRDFSNWLYVTLKLPSVSYRNWSSLDRRQRASFVRHAKKLSRRAL